MIENVESVNRLGRFRPYPEYKDSEVKWLRNVPVYWDIVQYKYFVDIQNGQDHKHIERNEGYPVIGSGGAFAYASNYLYDGESVLLGRKGTIDKPIYVNGPFWTVDTMYWTKINPSVSGRFAYYLATTIPFEYYSTNTALPSMTKSNLGGHFVNRPPLPEQRAIAAFLDRETGRIDELVAKKERLIELLQEKRSALITHAVTKGLDPNAPMKPSGIEWLGDIPAHWQTMKLNYLFKIKKCIAGKLGYDILAITKGGVKIKDTESGEGQLSKDYSKYQIVMEGDFAMNHMDLVSGFVDISAYHGVTSPDYRVFSLQNEKNFDRYYLYIMQMCYLEKLFYPFGQGSSHIGRWRLPRTQFLQFVFPLPPRKEQKKIAVHLDKEIRAILKLNKKIGDAIEKLKEYRTALISAAVTGKIDVREEAA